MQSWPGRDLRRSEVHPGEQPCERGPGKEPLERRKVLAHAGDHRGVEGRAALRHLLVKDVLADHDARAAVLELVAHLVARGDRAYAWDRGAALERGEVGDHELR